MATSKIKAPFGAADVRVEARQTCHEGFLRVEKLTLRHRLFGGGWSASIQRELTLRRPAVGVLLFDPWLERVVLVRQFRVGMLDAATPWALELVAGLMESGESPACVARRECEEEAACVPDRLEPIATYYNSPGATNERTTLLCGRVDASGAGGVHGRADEHEDIEVVVLGADEALTALERGHIDNAMTLIALQWLRANRERLGRAWR